MPDTRRRSALLLAKMQSECKKKEHTTTPGKEVILACIFVYFFVSSKINSTIKAIPALAGSLLSQQTSS
jgi:hypothetical protein